MPKSRNVGYTVVMLTLWGITIYYPQQLLHSCLTTTAFGVKHRRTEKMLYTKMLTVGSGL